MWFIEDKNIQGIFKYPCTVGYKVGDLPLCWRGEGKFISNLDLSLLRNAVDMVTGPFDIRDTMEQLSQSCGGVGIKLVFGD